MANQKIYVLDDGRKITTCKVSEITGLSLAKARDRLTHYSDPALVLAPKQDNVKDTFSNYKMRMIMKRGINDKMYVLAFKTI